MLDAGGLPACSSTVIMGPSGSGKTSLALQFLSQSSAESPGLALGFFESPDRLLCKGDALGLKLREVVRLGAIEFLWRAPGSYLLDQLGYLLLEEIDKRGVQRLVIDGVAGIFAAVGFPQRQHRFVACLMNEIRRRGVTVMLTLEVGGAGQSAGSGIPEFGLSAWIDNLITLHQIRSGTGVAGAIAIGKIRDSGYDRSFRSFEITGSGVALGSPLALAERREV
jgi:circadian clock protein KaiC